MQFILTYIIYKRKCSMIILIISDSDFRNWFYLKSLILYLCLFSFMLSYPNDINTISLLLYPRYSFRATIPILPRTIQLLKAVLNIVLLFFLAWGISHEGFLITWNDSALCGHSAHIIHNWVHLRNFPLDF